MAVVGEKPLEAGVRPPPVVDRRGVVDLDAVGRGEHAPAGSRDAAELPHRLRRVVAVLEHLRERTMSNHASSTGSASTGPSSSAAAFSTTSTPTYSEATARVRVVGLHAAADVENAYRRFDRTRLVGKPARERVSHDPGRRALPRPSAIVPGPAREVVRHDARVPRDAYRSSFSKAANAGFFFPLAVSTPTASR